MPWAKPRQIFLCEPEQTHCGWQTPAMLCVRWMFESLLKMNESTGRLDQPFEIIRITRFGLEPKLLENVMSLVITLFVPAMEKRAIKGVVCDVCPIRISTLTGQLGHKPRNPLAFVHGALNLLAAQIMSKPALISSSEGENHPPQAGDFSRPAWLRRHKR